jgi:origin recognition complex subunit 4
VLAGPRGAGKSHTVNYVLGQYQKLITVSVDGTMCADDEQVAVRSINEQIADQLAIQVPEYEEQVDSIAQGIEIMWSALRKAKQEGIPVVIVLEEFHEFAITKSGKQKQKQALLYNLFDMLQSASVMLCIIPITVYVDVFDLLEKRIRSRISHRKILFFSYTAPETCSILREYLTDNSASNPGYANLVEKLLNDSAIQMLSVITPVIKQYVELGKRLPWFLSVVKLMTTSLSNDTTQLYTKEAFEAACKRMLLDQKLVPMKLGDCTVLEIVILVAIIRMYRKGKDREFSCNLALAFDEYSLSTKHLHSEAVQRFNLEYFRSGLEGLFSKGILQPLPSSNSSDSSNRGSSWMPSPLSLTFPLSSGNSAFSSIWMMDFAPIEIARPFLSADSVEELSSFIQHSLKCPTWIKTWVSSSI